MGIKADVFVAEGLSDAVLDEIDAALQVVGVESALLIVPPRRSWAEAWEIASVLIAYQSFFSHLAENFADDAHDALKSLVQRVLHKAPKEPPGAPVLVLHDPATGVRIVLEADLPAKSYQQLLSLDLSVVQRGPLHYDVQRGRWRSELDEAGTGPLQR
jgi:hypothetical protein